MNVTIITAIISAFVTIAGWLVSNYIIRKKEDRTKRLQIILDHTREQIEELYGPLYSLINQVFIYWHVEEKILKPLEENTKQQLEKYFREKYFANLHTEIKELLKTKFHLIEGVEFPKSYWDYLQHSTQEAAQINIWRDLQINTSHVEGHPWPYRFQKDVKAQLDSLMSRYDMLLKELK